VAIASGCATPNPLGALGDNKAIQASCPADTKLATKVDIDLSASSRTGSLSTERHDAIADMARLTAICGGRLKVTGFSATSASTFTLYDDDLRLAGATDNARLRQVPEVVDHVLSAVNDAYPTAVQSLEPSGSDIVAQYRLADEYVRQLGPGYQLRLVLLTDGLQNAGFTLDQSITSAQAEELANNVVVPQLPGASIVVAGIGKDQSQPPPSTVVEAVVAFYDALCRRTGAATCLSVTDYTTAGR
jgi:hypothetical protein